MFEDDSISTTEGYGFVDRDGITFLKVANANGLKHNLIWQLCDANYIVAYFSCLMMIMVVYDDNDDRILGVNSIIFVIDVWVRVLGFLWLWRWLDAQ